MPSARNKERHWWVHTAQENLVEENHLDAYGNLWTDYCSPIFEDTKNSSISSSSESSIKGVNAYL